MISILLFVRCCEKEEATATNSGGRSEEQQQRGHETNLLCAMTLATFGRNDDVAKASEPSKYSSDGEHVKGCLVDKCYQARDSQFF